MTLRCPRCGAAAETSVCAACGAVVPDAPSTVGRPNLDDFAPRRIVTPVAPPNPNQVPLKADEPLQEHEYVWKPISIDDPQKSRMLPLGKPGRSAGRLPAVPSSARANTTCRQVTRAGRA